MTIQRTKRQLFILLIRGSHMEGVSYHVSERLGYNLATYEKCVLGPSFVRYKLGLRYFKGRE